MQMTSRMEGYSGMSDTAGRRIDRREFIRAGLAVAGGVFALGPQRCLAAQAKEQSRWAFLSDTHIPADIENNYRGFYPYRNLEKVAGQIAASLPEGLVITGDLARLMGLADDYANLKKLLTPLIEKRPVYMALGNHDDRNNFLQTFKSPAGDKQPIKGKHALIVDAGPVRFILLDSLLTVNQTPGLLGKAQRTWLEEYLGTGDDRPTILFFHHTLGDNDGDLLDTERLFSIIKPASKVKALVYGHSHAYGFSELDGIHLINVPATGYTFGDNQPVGWLEARLTGQAGEFVLHAAGGNTKLDGATKVLRWRT